jgi:uncharacterized protein (TIGR00369 family)
MRTAEAVAEALVSAPYVRFVGATLDTAEPGRVRLALPARADTTNRGGSLHGGVTASLLDVAGMAAARTAAEAHEGPTSTIDLAVHYLAPVVREAVVVEGIVTRRGRGIVFVEASVTTAGGALVARSIGAVRLGIDGADDEPPPSAPPCPIDQTTPLVPRRSGSAFTARLGVQTARLAPGHAILVLPAHAALADADGSMHEGALAALVDCAGGAASWSVDGFDPRGRAATIGMHLCWDRTPVAEDVVVEALTSWRAGGIFLNTVTLTARTTGRPVATGSVTYRIVRSEP